MIEIYHLKFSGAASGIGSAICSKFASEGAKIVLVDRNQKKLLNTYESLNDKFGNNHMHECGDVSSTIFAEKLFRAIQVCFLCY